MKRILFLDFDGVLHPAGPGSAKFSRLGLLADLLRDPAFADVQIVVSSTWREIHSLARLRGFFPPDLQPRVIGSTPVLDEYDSDYPRAEEIEAWLEEQSPAPAWAALDDDMQGISTRLKNRVVFTDSSIGLTAETLTMLRVLLANSNPA